MINQNEFVHFVAKKLHQSQRSQKAFALFDQDQKGMIVLEDLVRVSKELDEHFTIEELQEMMRVVDTSGDDHLVVLKEDFQKLGYKLNL